MRSSSFEGRRKGGRVVIDAFLCCTYSQSVFLAPFTLLPLLPKAIAVVVAAPFAMKTRDKRIAPYFVFYRTRNGPPMAKCRFCDYDEADVSARLKDHLDSIARTIKSQKKSSRWTT
jgi:hypothetical protein